MKRIPFNIPDIGEEEIKEVVNTLKSGWLTTGPKTRQFEDEFAKYIGCKYAIAVNSCTAALHLALLAHGIKRGDGVITTPYTFAATSGAIIYTGATPIFVDIDKNTFNVEPGKIESKIQNPKSKIKALIPVHIAGQPCDMDDIMSIAKRHNLIVIEDAAHALSAEYKDKKIGTLGNATCFSFYATKNLTTGEGGMITTDDIELANKVRILSLHGMDREAWQRYAGGSTRQASTRPSWYYEILTQGYKYNMMDLQASIGLAQLKKLSEMQKKREKIAELYNKELGKLEELSLPKQEESIKHAWHLYIILIRPELLRITRNEFIEELNKIGIGTSVHYIPLHLMPYYKHQYGFKKGDFPNAEWVYERAISLPLYPGLSENDAMYVAETIKKIVKHNI